MIKPQYWEDDEKWAAYEEWLANSPEAIPEPMSALQKAIRKARGDIDTPEDMADAIGLCNALSRIITGRHNEQA